MCPLCIGTATLLVSGGTSAGGFAALLVRLRTRKNRSIAPAADDRIMSTRVESRPRSTRHCVT